MNDFEAALYGDEFKDAHNGYRKYIDVEIFAKRFLVQELTGNLEPDMYYVLPSRDARLQMAPVWDAEWSMGLAYRKDEYASWAGLPAEPDWDQEIWSRWNTLYWHVGVDLVPFDTWEEEVTYVRNSISYIAFFI